jgi:hypothetical protein
MCRKERDVIGDRPFNPFFFDGQVRKITALEFSALPSDRAKIGRWSKQLFCNRLAPFVDQPKPVFVLRLRERGAIGNPV